MASEDGAVVLAGERGRGVLQGSSLLPLQYSLYTADFPKAETVKTTLYVDDVAIYATSLQSQTAVAKIQIYLDRLPLPYIWQNNTKIKTARSNALPSQCHKMTRIKKNVPSKRSGYQGTNENKLLHGQKTAKKRRA